MGPTLEVGDLVRYNRCNNQLGLVIEMGQSQKMVKFENEQDPEWVTMKAATILWADEEWDEDIWEEDEWQELEVISENR